MAYIAVLCIAGFITNLFPFGVTNTGTILLYALAMILCVAGLLYLLGPLQKHAVLLILSILVLSGLALAKALVDTNEFSQRTREFVILGLGSWPVLLFAHIDSRRTRERLLTTLAIGLFFLCSFAIFQSVFADILPTSLFALRGDIPFSVDDDQILRPTGLTGNPIIFSSILVLASAHFGAFWLERRKFRYLFALIVSLLANYLTYTRASLILVVPVLAVVWLLHKRFKIRHKISLLFALLLVMAAGQFLLVRGVNLIMVQRLSNSDASTIGSTLEHIVQIQNSANAIIAHPFVGAGFGSQGDFVGPDNVIITDGAWWILVLEFGVPLAVLTIILLCAVLRSFLKYVLRPESKDRELAIAALAFHAYIIPGSIINSALLGHISFGLYWVLMGLAVSTLKVDPKLNPSSVSDLYAPRARRFRPELNEAL